ncbi:MAG: hypothetical protein ACRERE_19780 [Candidatus Entotheonellia bacterium]
MTLTVSVNLRKTTQGLLRSAFVCTAAALVVQRLAMWTKTL